MSDQVLRYGPNFGVWRRRVLHRRTKAKARVWTQVEGREGPDTWWLDDDCYQVELFGKKGLMVQANHLLTPDTARVFAADLNELADEAESRLLHSEDR